LHSAKSYVKTTAKEEEDNAHKCAHKVKLENCASTPRGSNPKISYHFARRQNVNEKPLTYESFL